MNKLLVGSIAGIVGTYAMTLAKDQMFEQLPKRQRYPLPPREITQDIIERLTGRRARDEERLTAATFAAHFGYGALCGATFTALNLHRRRPVLSGLGFGLLVWADAYLGWLPMSRILTPASRHPAQRNLVMLASHAVWGAVTGYAATTLMHAEHAYRTDDRNPSRLRDRR
ncbi:MAG: hypothetical protein ACNA7W_02290 [Pseudomonadales bacterium]